MVQRVARAEVRVGGETTGRIGPGLLVLAGFGRGDREDDLRAMAEKLLDLRLFPDAEGRMNVALRENRRELLLVPQFTLYGDCRKGRRPSFDAAEEPARARELFDRFLALLRDAGFSPQRGIFGADMRVELVNDGPVTLLLDSGKAF